MDLTNGFASVKHWSRKGIKSGKCAAIPSEHPTKISDQVMFSFLKSLWQYWSKHIHQHKKKFHSPSAMAPRANMPDSFLTQSGDMRTSFSGGRRTVSSESWKTFDRTSNAAAEHFLKFHSVISSLSSSSSSSSSSPAGWSPEGVAACGDAESIPPCVFDLWKRGLISVGKLKNKPINRWVSCSTNRYLLVCQASFRPLRLLSSAWQCP